MISVIKYFAKSLKSLKVIEHVTIRKLGTFSYSYFIATVVVSFAVSTQHTNVTAKQTQHGVIGRACS